MRRAGLLNEIIDIYTLSASCNDYGEREEVYTKTYTTRAAVQNDGGVRNVVNSEIVYPYGKSFIVRYYVPISDTSQIEWQNKRYRVISVEKRRAFNDILIKTEIINE